MGIHCATTEPLAGQMDKLNPTLQRLGRPMDAAAPWISSHLCPGRQHSTSVKSHQKIGYRYFVFYPFDLGRIRPPHLSRPCRAHARYHKWGALGTLRCMYEYTPGHFLASSANNQVPTSATLLAQVRSTRAGMAHPLHSRRLVFAGGSPASPQTAQQVGSERIFPSHQKNGTTRSRMDPGPLLGGKGVQEEETR